MIKSIQNKKTAIIGAGLIVYVIIVCTGCIADGTTGLAGTYSDVENNKTTLIIYENNTFFNKERAGYLMGEEVAFTVTGTYTRKGDLVVFSGDGVITIAYIHGDDLIVEGSKYCKI